MIMGYSILSFFYIHEKTHYLRGSPLEIDTSSLGLLGDPMCSVYCVTGGPLSCLTTGRERPCEFNTRCRGKTYLV